MSKLDTHLEHCPAILLDGGLATELQRRGLDIDDPLWSARVLVETPAAIRTLHEDYLRAGADCIITSSYQASFGGLQARGLSHAQSEAILRRSVQLAREARDNVARTDGADGRRAANALVAASIGPYGATLHDGSEYRGDYGLSVDELAAFHGPRLRILADAGADLLAFETIPCRAEAEALLQLLRDTAGMDAWFSFSCRDESHVSHGETLAECAALLKDKPRVAAIGINCTAPRYVSTLIKKVKGAAGKPIVVYPNSGERWDRAGRRWTGVNDPRSFGALAADWRDAGAALIGGCCRTGPDHIRAIAARLTKN